ncbi:unnamed protein product [Hymenolepis diminuta]|nr:unnamed protein product [Hymenolepis diminuta]
MDKFSDVEQADKKGWRIFTKNDGSLFLKKGVDGDLHKVTYEDQYEVSVEESGRTVCKGRLLSELMQDVVKKTGTEKASRRMGATLIYKQDLLYFVGRFRLKSDSIQIKDDDNDSKNLGKGEFGEVFLGKYCDSKNSNVTRQVAIKRVKQESEYALTGGMELAVLATFSGSDGNKYLLPFIGWYSDRNNLYVVTEYMPNGCLQERLKSVFLNNNEKNHIERINQYRYVFQIALGMQVMEENKLVHRDLAARNIFLDKNNDIKIGDFGLSRPFESQYSSGLIAVRWTAPEVLANENEFENRADVWSFGVVVWEIYSFGSLPYSDVPGHRLSALLQEGKRLDRPVNTPDKMATLMERCWQLKPEERLSFSDIVKDLTESKTSNNQTDQPPPPPPPPPRSESSTPFQRAHRMNSRDLLKQESKEPKSKLWQLGSRDKAKKDQHQMGVGFDDEERCNKNAWTERMFIQM